jgi:hypothetical protein
MARRMPHCAARASFVALRKRSRLPQHGKFAGPNAFASFAAALYVLMYTILDKLYYPAF